MAISVSGLSKSFALRDGTTLKALEGIDLAVGAGEFACVVGHSGCGKTTLLRILAGLDQPTAGSFRLDSAPLGTRDVPVAMVFQDYSRSLFPWFTVREQLEVTCRSRGIAREEMAALVDEALDLTSLTDCGTMLPRELSGGMQQRVALARAIVTQAPTLLLDEPFGSVDAQTRYELEDEVLRLWQVRRLTVLLITHDIDEALYLADRVFVLSRRPARVLANTEVALARPRLHGVTRSDPHFGVLRKKLWQGLHREP